MTQQSNLRLDDGSRVAVIGGGPAGSFFSYFLLVMAERLGVDVHVDIYEPKNFSKTGPAGCNMCGGIISESLVQLLATEGINLPTDIVQRGIDSYVLHMDVGTVRIDPPGREKRIAAIHRGSGPRGIAGQKWNSFDGYLLELAKEKGAVIIKERVEDITWTDGKPSLKTNGSASGSYDLLVVSAGVNSAILKHFEGLGMGYKAPGTAKTYISEFLLGQETIEKYFGNSMHVFLLNLPRLKFAAIIPKGDYVTVCLLGSDIDKQLVDSFLNASEVRRCFPPAWTIPPDFCHCSPLINVLGSPKPYTDRVVFIGDSGESRLYKDGIGAAYRTAKAAAKTAVFEGVSEEDFRQHYMPGCRKLNIDNRIGKVVFMVTTLIQNVQLARCGLLNMITTEQNGRRKQRMSGVLWDTFTGSAPYADVFLRSVHPFLLGHLFYNTMKGLLGVNKAEKINTDQDKEGR